MKKKWRLLAEMCDFESNTLKWKRLEIGPHRRVRCSCGGGVIDNPGSGQYEGGACSHIAGLYAGAITEDKREYREIMAKRESAGLWAKDRYPFKHLTRFTELGRKMFYVRYTVRALKHS